MPKKTFFNLPEAKRQRIIEQAILEFSERPYPQASLTAIVARCGISKGSIYQYFQNKYDLYHWLIFEHVAQQKLAFMRTQMTHEPSQDSFEMLEQMFLAGISWGLANPRLSKLGDRLFDQSDHPDVQAIQAETRAQGQRWMQTLLLRAQSMGQLREGLNLELASKLLLHTLRASQIEILPDHLGVTMMAWMADPSLGADFGPEQQRAYVHEIIQFLRYGLGKP